MFRRNHNDTWDTKKYRDCRRKVRKLTVRELLSQLDQLGTDTAFFAGEYRKHDHHAELQIIRDNINAMQAVADELQVDHDARYVTLD